MNDDMPIDEKRQLEDYQRLSALFQFYLELTLKAFTFALGIAGGVSAFVLGKEVSDRHLAAFGLLLPSALCIGMGVAFLRAVPSTRELNEALQTALRRLGLVGTELAHAQVQTIRLKLLKLGAVIVRNTRRIRIWFSSSFPLQELFRNCLACFYG